MRARFVRVTTALLTGLALPFVATAPAWARLDDGEAPSHTGWLFVVLVYVGIPLGFFLLVAALTYGPSVRRRPRYRPTRDWQADAVWFNGPADPEHALGAGSSVVVKGGGASASW
ncbi:MAG: hypothetical protein QOF39_2999 [Frankiales bacterium]|nr:hypothetical protein [Frankiales bacterium]